MPVEIPILPSSVFGSSPGVLHKSVGGGIGIFAKAVKRFTETNKWRDPWYRKLSSPAKQLWEYLRDNCDAIGLVEIDLSLASGDCGQQITDAHVSELGDRIQRLSEKKLFLTKFIAFQYGELNSACPPHRTIIKLVTLHCLVRVGLHYRYPNATLPESPVKSEVANNQQNSHYPNARVATTLQDKTRLEEYKTGTRQEDGGEGGRRESNFPEHNGRMTLQEVKDTASMIGLAEWKAVDWFQEMEGCGWLDHNQRPVHNGRAILARVKTKWESDGRPTSPPKGKYGPKPPAENPRNFGMPTTGKQAGERAVAELKARGDIK